VILIYLKKIIFSDNIVHLKKEKRVYIGKGASLCRAGLHTHDGVKAAPLTLQLSVRCRIPFRPHRPFSLSPLYIYLSYSCLQVCVPPVIISSDIKGTIIQKERQRKKVEF